MRNNQRSAGGDGFPRERTAPGSRGAVHTDYLNAFSPCEPRKAVAFMIIDAQTATVESHDGLQVFCQTAEKSVRRGFAYQHIGDLQQVPVERLCLQHGNTFLPNSGQSPEWVSRPLRRKTTKRACECYIAPPFFQSRRKRAVRQNFTRNSAFPEDPFPQNTPNSRLHKGFLSFKDEADFLKFYFTEIQAFFTCVSVKMKVQKCALKIL